MSKESSPSNITNHEYGNDKKDNAKSKKLLQRAGGAVALLAMGGALAACSTGDKVGATPAPSETTISYTPDRTLTTPTNAPTETSPATNPNEMKAPELDKTIVNRIKNLPPEKLNMSGDTQHDFQVYALSKWKEIGQHGYLSNFIGDKKLPNGKQIAEYFPYDMDKVVGALGKDALPEEILYQNELAQIIAMVDKQDLSTQEASFNRTNDDIQESYKMTDSFALTSGDHNAAKVILRANANKRSNVRTFVDTPILDKVDTAKPLVNEQGKDYTAKREIVVDEGGVKTTRTYYFTPMDKELGKGKGLWVVGDIQ